VDQGVSRRVRDELEGWVEMRRLLCRDGLRRGSTLRRVALRASIRIAARRISHSWCEQALVNLASVEDVATRERLLLMARKLLRFMSLLALVAVVLGMWLLGHGAKTAGWMHAKLALVALLIGYHGWCALLLMKFASGRNTRSHLWFRWFNEVPVLLLVAIVALAVVKPF